MDADTYLGYNFAPGNCRYGRKQGGVRNARRACVARYPIRSLDHRVKPAVARALLALLQLYCVLQGALRARPPDRARQCAAQLSAYRLCSSSGEPVGIEAAGSGKTTTAAAPFAPVGKIILHWSRQLLLHLAARTRTRSTADSLKLAKKKTTSVSCEFSVVHFFRPQQFH
eukprot:6214791-Pleurochrysis_carterae.AAC.4